MSALVIDGNLKLLSVECCLETKMRRDVTTVDVMADTIGYIQIKMKSATLQLAIIIISAFLLGAKDNLFCVVGL